jgi:phosphotransferase system enzyme I (PtsI)
MAAIQNDPRTGREFRGIPASPGFAVGPVVALSFHQDVLIEKPIGPDQVDSEIERLNAALDATRAQILDIEQQVDSVLGQEHARIFQAHRLVVDDPQLINEVVQGIREEGRNAEVVLSDVADKYADVLKGMGDVYLRERGADILDVKHRILRNLDGGSRASLSELTLNCVVTANDLPPSEAACLDKEHVVGIATEVGSHTSHTAIMARALEIPAVVGIPGLTDHAMPGDTLLVDGTHGVVILNPTAEQLAEYDRLASTRREVREELQVLQGEPAETVDGYALVLSANIELVSDIDSARRYGARGVGLFRTEYLYIASDDLPTEEQQTDMYSAVARALAPDPVVIRTLDIGGDKIDKRFDSHPGANPFLGWRAIRFCLGRPDIFKTQLRAILRSSVHGNVKIMYPLVSIVDEVIAANRILDEVRDELTAEGVPFDADIEVGVMIEVPSAALTAELIAPHVRFFSLGTNDLVQYTLAVDRVDLRVAHLYDPTHPSVMKLIRHTIEVAHDAGLWVGVCGEMGANPLLALLLLGMGVDEISMTPADVPAVKDVIRSVSYGQAATLAAEAHAAASGEEILALCRTLVEETAPEVLALLD